MPVFWKVTSANLRMDAIYRRSMMSSYYMMWCLYTRFKVCCRGITKVLETLRGFLNGWESQKKLAAT